MMYLIIIILGLVIGSFLNVCIYRIPKKESIIYPPSHCINCGHRLHIFDLIPVISYIFLKGRCRYCTSKISINYLIIELINALLYFILFIKFEISAEFFSYCFLISFLLIVFVIDLNYKIIPNKLNLFGFSVILIIKIAESLYYLSFAPLIDSILGLLIGATPILLVILISNGAMGAGDMKLMAVIGMWFGLKFTYLILVIGLLAASIMAVIILITKNGTKKSQIPFAPFLSISTFICLIFGQNILDFIFIRSWFL